MRLLRKFRRAGVGLKEVFWAELSIKIEILIGLLVLGAAYYLRLPKLEFLIALGTVFMVIILEALNTILEAVIDLAEPRYHEIVRRLKDALAALVLLAVLLAAVVGLVIFWPYLNK
ncbi:MAG: diacylglycerol kinase family protein [Patescibacteria group bacterium]